MGSLLRTVEVYFDPISPYAYLALEELVKRSSDAPRVAWRIRPVVYAKLLEAHGLIGPVETEAKRRYTMLDVVRCAERHGLKIEGPPTHPFRSLSALRVLMLFAESDLARIIHEPRGKTPRIGSCWHFADTCPRRRPCKVVEDASICKVPAGTNRPAVPVVRGVWSACS
ncbi:MAG: hypothetical protein ACI8TQ_000436 [Planctomycetota bacterium]|jgi:hypothetical protein